MTHVSSSRPGPSLVLVALLALPIALGAPPAGAAPLKVATLVPWVGEALALVPERATVVASTRKFVHGPPPGKALDLGDGHAPNLELLVSTAPQLVVADRRWHARFGEQVERSGAEVLWIEADSVQSTLEAAIAIGRRVGAEAEMRAAADAVEHRLEAMRLDAPQKVLALFGAPGSYLVISDRTWIGDLLARLGFEAVVPADATERMPGYLAVSDEFLASVEPDVVLLLAHGDPTSVSAAFREDWRRVRKSAPPVVALDPLLFATNPGLRILDAAESILAGRVPRTR